MNPFTRFLATRVQNQSLQQLVAYWDRLERLVIRVYKSQQATPEDEQEWIAIRPVLHDLYPLWTEKLTPLWLKTAAGGKKVTEDPFTALLMPAHAADFINNWRAMQTLPAARESLNQFLLQNP